MATDNNHYEFIEEKIHATKSVFPSLRSKSDDYAFSALCVRAHLYKNPALTLVDSDLEEMIVDGQYDGGVDALLADPSSEASDLIIAQSKFYRKISQEDVLNALTKMASFYHDMVQGHYERVNEKVQRRYLSLSSELGEESKIHFVFYTSAPQSGINKPRLEKKFRELIGSSEQFEISIFFGKDLVEEIKESESRRPTVEKDKIKIDFPDNFLLYGEDAVIVNVSAFSIKTLYARYSTQLLAQNLRYHIKSREVDKGIEQTIKDTPELFWLKNNGITIVCSDFDVDGKEVKLFDFSIINGGQTSFMIHKSHNIDEEHDFFLPCKIIKIEGDTEDEKISFSLAIAQATNTQKPIKPVDLKANSPEQVRFAKAMREAGLFYLTKRGEEVPKQYKAEYLNTSLVEIGKLCLAAIFQMPGLCRNKPSTLYQPKYYDVIFDGDQSQIAQLSKELLYIDYYFRKVYLKKFDKDNAAFPMGGDYISFAHNARTICVAFVAFASRYYWGNLSEEDLNAISATSKSDYGSERLYNIFANIEGVRFFIPPEIFQQKDIYDSTLDRLFDVIIKAGSISYSMALRHDQALNATNYLKRDVNYYAILADHWPTMSGDIKRIFDEINK